MTFNFLHTGVPWNAPLSAAVAGPRREQTLRCGHPSPRDPRQSPATTPQHTRCKQKIIYIVESRKMKGYVMKTPVIQNFRGNTESASTICENLRGMKRSLTWFQSTRNHCHHLLCLWSTGPAEGAAGQASSAGVAPGSVVSSAAQGRGRGERRIPGEALCNW